MKQITIVFLILLVCHSFCFPSRDNVLESTTEEATTEDGELQDLDSRQENLDSQGTDNGLYNADMFEGDILLSASQQLLNKNAIKDSTLLWPYGAIPYTIDPSVGCPESWRCKMLMDAMEHYHETSCIRFVEWSGEPYSVDIFLNPESTACWSPVGRTSMSQPLSLGSQCWYRGIVLHELLHAVGFWHEMTRPDRDSYIQIFWPNILNGYQSVFYKQNAGEVDTLGERFDYRSVMMYDEYAFSKDGISETLRATKPGVVIGPIWKKTRFSKSDLRRLHALYSCNGNAPLDGFPYNLACDFNSDSCGFKNGGSAQWSWRRVTASEGFMFTRRETGHATKGYLQSVTMHPNNRGREGCAMFWYYMDSSAASNLTLMHAYLQTATQVNFNPATTYVLWSNDHISESSWNYVHIPIYVDRPFKLLFVSNFDVHSTRGEIGVDDFEISYSPCYVTTKNEEKNSTTKLKDDKNIYPSPNIWDESL